MPVPAIVVETREYFSIAIRYPGGMLVYDTDFDKRTMLRFSGVYDVI